MSPFIDEWFVKAFLTSLSLELPEKLLNIQEISFFSRMRNQEWGNEGG